MINREILKKISSADYTWKLEETLTSIIQKMKSANSESTVASIFENELYHFIKSFFEKEIIFYKESGSSFLRHKFEGRMDAFSNNLIIEYKSVKNLHSKASQASAINQVTNYLMQIYNETGNTFQAILTNGKKICYFYFYEGKINCSSFKSFDTNDLDRLVKTLINVGLKQFDPRNIVQDFKMDSQYQLTNNLAKSLYNVICQNMTKKTRMLFEEWQVLFRLSETDNGQNLDIIKRRKILSSIFEDTIENNEKEYVALYTLQTTYAIIVKLIACKVLSKLAYNDDIMYFSDLSIVDSQMLQEFMIKLEDGYVFSTGGIKNLLEGDFFSWYSDLNQWNNQMYESIKSIVSELGNYASSSFTYEYSTIDIFKDLYMEVMPNEVRHSLGEYFTPAWLADQVVNESIQIYQNNSDREWKAIDPCCGSGIFIISLIRRILADYDLYALTSEEKTIVLNQIISRVFGVDLNPLSVLTARVSYLLAIFPLLDNQKFEIPVYLGDSANVPRKIDVQSIACFTYVVDTVQGSFEVTLPCDFVNSESFSKKMYMLQTTIKAEDTDLLLNQFLSYIGSDNLNKKIIEKIRNLSFELVNLHKNEWDGIWVRIVSNFMLIARINDIDLIVGNPPWVKWEYLPQNYANKIKDICIDRSLFSGQVYMGAISLNLCALIANVTASSWLTKEGVLAFLMPKTIMTQDSYAGFRNFHLDEIESNKRLYLQRIDDWSKSGNPFVVTTEKFLTYFYTREVLDYSLGIPINIYTKNRNNKITDINHFHNFDLVSKFFEKTDGMAYQLDKNRTGFTMIPERNFDILKDMHSIIGDFDYKARSGVEFTPAEVYFLESSFPAKTKDSFIFSSAEFKNSIYKNNYGRHFELETNYIYPVIKGPKIQPFKIAKSDNYCIFPYDGTKELISIEELSQNSPNLMQYLLESKKLITKQSKRSKMISVGDEFYALSKVGDYTFTPHKVAFRDNTNMCASVVFDVTTAWGKKVRPICAKHSPYISMDKNNCPITKEEAYYICSILNTPIVNKYFNYTYSGRSYSINFNIKIPKYNSSNKLQAKLSELGKKATNFPDDVEEIINEIQEVYIKLCKSDSSN